MTEPDQYFYNPAFHFKLLCIALAGLNVLVCYGTMFRRVSSLPPHSDTPLQARIASGVSLFLWTGVIICGRLITFYRPFPCENNEVQAFFVRCLLL